MSSASSSTPLRRRVLRAVPWLAAAALLAACSSGSSSAGGAGDMSGMDMSTPMATAMATAATTQAAVTPGPAAAGAHDAADVAFATGMIPHHGQAVQMAAMVLATTRDADVKALATAITAAQTPEIAAMAGWLAGWGETVPDAYSMDASMGGMAMNGMMSAEQMKSLSSATGTAADKAFLTLMITHHQGALEMARTELADGANPTAKKLAQAVVTGQTAEITKMQTMLTAMG